MARSGNIWMGALVAFALIQATTTPHPAAAQVDKPTLDEIRTHYSLYWEHFKNGNYEDALPDLRWSLKYAPASTYNDDRNFRRGVILYDSLAARTDDPVHKRVHLDAALVLFDEAVRVLPPLEAKIDVFRWTLDKGRFIQHHLDVLDDLKDEAVDAYRRAYEMDSMRLNPYYFDIICRDDVSKENYDEALDFLQEIEKKRGEEEEVRTIVARCLAAVSPEKQLEYLQKQHLADMNNPEPMRQIVAFCAQVPELCTGIDLKDMLTRLIEIEPTPSLFIQLADICLADGDYARALELYERLLALPEYEPTADLYYNMGFAEHQLDNLIPARAHYRKAMALDPSFGMAYLAIGDLYVAAVSQCAGATLERRDKAVYWLAVDWWDKARRLASPVASVVNEATLKIDTYRRYFPKADERFFEGWTTGQAFPINYGCYSWIGETTTVRDS